MTNTINMKTITITNLRNNKPSVEEVKKLRETVRSSKELKALVTYCREQTAKSALSSYYAGSISQSVEDSSEK